MAMIDYGAVVFKNGVQINLDDMFMNMKEAVGWSEPVHYHPDYDTSKKEITVDGNHFAYVGNEHVTLCFYKTHIMVIINKLIVNDIYGNEEFVGKVHKVVDEDFSYDQSIYRHHRSHWHSYENGKVRFRIRTVGDSENVFWCYIKIGDDHYNIIYGYGIDYDRKTWNRAKIVYLGARQAKKVDALYRKIKRTKLA